IKPDPRDKRLRHDKSYSKYPTQRGFGWVCFPNRRRRKFHYCRPNLRRHDIHHRGCGHSTNSCQLHSCGSSSRELRGVETLDSDSMDASLWFVLLLDSSLTFCPASDPGLIWVKGTAA